MCAVTLESGLWIDGPNAPTHLAGLIEEDSLTTDEASKVEHFVERGYVVLDMPETLSDTGVYERLLRDVDALWSGRPAEIAFARDSPAVPLSSVPSSERQPSYRLHDIHSHSEAARSLYLDPALHRWIGLLFGQDPIAIQSLFFEWGSQQVLHRDPVVVPTAHPGHLIGAWIALEDIHADSGALAYVPGSHRYPYFEFAPGEHMYDALAGTADQIERALEHDEKHCRELGLEVRLFTPKKGQVLLWHANLRHGGGPLRDATRTRKSFVVHFSTGATAKERSNTLVVNGSPTVMTTTQIIEDDGRRGFQNPCVRAGD